jgi:preprotein translocase, YajC subunit
MLIAATQGSNPLVTFAPLILLGLVFYVILIRPQQRRAKAQQALLRSIEVGDQVVTGGGMFGHVVAIDDDEGIVTLEIAEGVEIQILRAGIGRRIEPYEEEDDDDSSEDRVSDEAPPAADQPDQSKEL